MKQHRAGIANECELPVRGVCEVRADSQITTGVAPRGDAGDGKKGEQNIATFAIFL